MVLPGMEKENENNLLAEFLSGRHYQKVSLRKLATGHLLLEACINDIPGAFILDSGAGATVVD